MQAWLHVRRNALVWIQGSDKARVVSFSDQNNTSLAIPDPVILEPFVSWVRILIINAIFAWLFHNTSRLKQINTN